jgi:hypothetical protein
MITDAYTVENYGRETMSYAMELVFACLIGVLLGWLIAHGEVATECQRQGGFYIGDKDYKCEVIKK